MKTERNDEKVTITMNREEYLKLGVLVKTGVRTLEMSNVLTEKALKEIEQISEKL